MLFILGRLREVEENVFVDAVCDCTVMLLLEKLREMYECLT